MRSALLAAAVVLAGCSTGGTTTTQPEPTTSVITPTVTSVTPRPLAKPVSPKPAGPTIEWYGTIYSVAYSDCAQKLWDDRVKRWNALTDAEREREVDSDHWFFANGWPNTHERTLLSPATRKACVGHR
jgi:hypothetical protein